MTPSRSEVTARRNAFRALHMSGCFLIPNPWDEGSARYLEGLGFKALATTSSGAAWAHGKPDGGMSRDEVLGHMREIVCATTLPVNADYEAGFAEDAEGVRQSVAMAVETGVAGISIEDASGVLSDPVRDISSAIERLRAARAAIDAAGGETLLIGRAENFLYGRTDVDDTIRRLQAYGAAGADVLYAPGLANPQDIAAVVKAVSPKPFNLLVGGPSDLTMETIQTLGVRRVSVGGALARAAWGGFLGAAKQLAEEGRFDGFEGAAAGRELNGFFAHLSKARRQ